jgi:CRISPR/Cas system-associated exonuclease Cas4 (RecB family)
MLAVNGVALDFDDLVDLAEYGLTDYPPEFVRAMRPDDALDGIRVTTLVSCLRKEILSRKYEYIESPEDFYARTRGRLIHIGLMHYVRPGAICLQRFERKIDSITITGEPDVIDPEGRTIRDFKVVSRIPKEPYASHTAQVNVYRWLVAETYRIEHLELFYLGPTSARRFEVPVWADVDAEQYVARRAKILTRGELPPRLTGREARLCRVCPLQYRCFSIDKKKSDSKIHNEAKTQEVPRWEQTCRVS